MYTNPLLVFIVLSGAALGNASDTCEEDGECHEVEDVIQDDQSAIQAFSHLIKGKRLAASSSGSSADPYPDFYGACADGTETSLECGDYMACTHFFEVNFPNVTNFQDLTDNKVEAFLDAMKEADDAMVTQFAQTLDGEEKDAFVNQAEWIVPKWDHIGRTLGSFVRAMEPGSLPTRNNFCSYVVYHMEMMDHLSPCTQFTELVRVEYQLATGEVHGWPDVTQMAGFDAAFQKACSVDGAPTNCADRLAVVKKNSTKAINEVKTSGSIPIATVQKYEKDLCKDLGYDDDVTLAEQKLTGIPAAAKQFVQIIPNIMAKKKTIYFKTAYEFAHMSIDIGSAIGHVGETSTHHKLRVAGFWSQCRIASTKIDFLAAGVHQDVMNTWDKVAGWKLNPTIKGVESWMQKVPGVGGIAKDLAAGWRCCSDKMYGFEPIDRIARCLQNPAIYWDDCDTAAHGWNELLESLWWPKCEACGSAETYYEKAWKSVGFDLAQVVKCETEQLGGHEDFNMIKPEWAHLEHFLNGASGGTYYAFGGGTASQWSGAVTSGGRRRQDPITQAAAGASSIPNVGGGGWR